MAQHFLTSAKARSLSLTAICRMSDEKAHDTFKALRWAENGGDPFCPFCGCLKIYTLNEQPIRWKCGGCRKKFSVTSNTVFASRKLPIREYLTAIALFVNGVKGLSALQLSRDLDINAKSAFVMLHKIREAMGDLVHDGNPIGGPGRDVEADGAYFGGHVKPTNKVSERKDRRVTEEKTGKRQVVVVLRERGGRALPFVVGKESDGVPMARKFVAQDAVMHADESRQWDALHASHDVRRINHSVSYSADGACTNQAESYFARLRRCEIGQHHHLSGRHLSAYANEIAWRENNRRVSTGEQWNLVTGAALAHPISRTWSGYWHRKAA